MKLILKTLSYLLVAVLSALVTMLLFFPRQIQRSDKLDELLYLADIYYVEDVDLEKLRDAAAYGIVEALGDRWSYYIPASDMQAHQEHVTNSYVGVGMSVMVKAGDTTVTVMEVTPGGSAQEAGIEAGDILYKVENTLCSTLNVDQIKELVRGRNGTCVRVTVLREGKESEFTLERRSIQTPVATSTMLRDHVGLITIENFDARCADETIAAIEELRSQGAVALVFDVRNNGGGYKDEMVKILDYLLPAGELFIGENYKGETSIDYSDEAYLDMPMAVLVNGHSYSAAELFAAALDEYDAAVTVGQKTTGKGYYQVTYNLSDGSAVAISTGKYRTPKGVSLEGVGITPEVLVEVDEEMDMQIYYNQLTSEEDPQIQAAIDALVQ